MPSDWTPDEDPRVQRPGDAGGTAERGRTGEDFRGVGEDADELLDDQDELSELDDDEEDDSAL